MPWQQAAAAKPLSLTFIYWRRLPLVDLSAIHVLHQTSSAGLYSPLRVGAQIKHSREQTVSLRAHVTPDLGLSHEGWRMLRFLNRSENVPPTVRGTEDAERPGWLKRRRRLSVLTETVPPQIISVMIIYLRLYLLFLLRFHYICCCLKYSFI